LAWLPEDSSLRIAGHRTIDNVRRSWAAAGARSRPHIRELVTAITFRRISLETSDPDANPPHCGCCRRRCAGI